MKKTAYFLLAAIGFSACNYLEIEPIGKVIPHKITEYRALLTEGYFRYPYYDAKAYTGVLSDEIGVFAQGYIWDSDVALALSYNYTWQYDTRMKEYPYRDYYRAIFQANAVIDGVLVAEKDSTEPAEQILGEALALRAYSHFELINLYGNPYNAATSSTDRGVPIATKIDIEQRYVPATVSAVYDQILSDLDEAGKQMSLEKQTDSTLNYRFSLNALTAFKARVKLYMGNWQEASDLATSLLPKYELFDFNAKVFDKTKLPWKGLGSPEAIMALERPFSGASGDLIPACILSDKIIGLFDQANDNRFTYLQMSGTLGYVLSDRSSSDRSSIRIAEMYLIAAEAGAHLPSELSNAKQHLLTLQTSRLKPAAMEAQRAKVEAMSAEQLLEEIANERAREFLLEGHRWMDLRRTTRPEIVKTHNGDTYTLRAGDSRYTLPFPQSAINSNPDLNN